MHKRRRLLLHRRPLRPRRGSPVLQKRWCCPPGPRRAPCPPRNAPRIRHFDSVFTCGPSASAALMNRVEAAAGGLKCNLRRGRRVAVRRQGAQQSVAVAQLVASPRLHGSFRTARLSWGRAAGRERPDERACTRPSCFLRCSASSVGRLKSNAFSSSNLAPRFASRGASCGCDALSRRARLSRLRATTARRHFVKGGIWPWRRLVLLRRSAGGRPFVPLQCSAAAVQHC